MAEVIYVQPDFTRNARIQGDAKEERNGGLDENTADNVIYDNVAVVVAASEKLQKPTEDKLQGADKAITEKRTPSRAAAVCLGLLTVLLFAAIVGLVIHYSNWEVEKSQLLERNANLSEAYNIAAGEANKLKSENDNLTQRISQSEEETARLQAVSNNIIKELQEMVNERECCPASWELFNRQCYKHFNSGKTWTKSKKDCEDHRANLVIIKSEEEQAFIKSKKWKGWIGLAKDNGTDWKWVDGSTLNEENAYWDEAKGQPSNSGENEDCVEIYYNLKWNDAPCNSIAVAQQWICQKGIHE